MKTVNKIEIPVDKLFYGDLCVKEQDDTRYINVQLKRNDELIKFNSSVSIEVIDDYCTTLYSNFIVEQNGTLTIYLDDWFRNHSDKTIRFKIEFTDSDGKSLFIAPFGLYIQSKVCTLIKDGQNKNIYE